MFIVLLLKKLCWWKGLWVCGLDRWILMNGIVIVVSVLCRVIEVWVKVVGLIRMKVVLLLCVVCMWLISICLVLDCRFFMVCLVVDVCVVRVWLMLVSVVWLYIFGLWVLSRLRLGLCRISSFVMGFGRWERVVVWWNCWMLFSLVKFVVF